MTSKNNAEHLIRVINGTQTFNGQKVNPSAFVWQCSTPNCVDSKPVIRQRKAYSHRMYCNACANRLKLLVPGFRAKRGAAIAKSIDRNKWREVGIKNMSNPETISKIREKAVAYYVNTPGAREKSAETAIKNNKRSGFGTSEFSENLWANVFTPEISKKIKDRLAESNNTYGEPEFVSIMNQRYPGFKLLEYSTPDHQLECPKGHVFWMRSNNFLRRGNCPECTPRSLAESEIFNYVKSLDPATHVDRNKRVLLAPVGHAKEIDVYVPSKKLGIEFHGLYFHSEEMINNDLHFKKAELAEFNGIRLLQFFEDEWNEKKEIVKSIIRVKLGLAGIKLDARKLFLSIDNDKVPDFFENNHLKGAAPSCRDFSLSDKDGNIVCALSIRKKYTKGTGVFEIARFACSLNTIVRGGFPKLLVRAIEYCKSVGGTKLVSYADRRYSNGKSYKASGRFKFVKKTVPDWYWTNKFQRFHRMTSYRIGKEEVAKRKWIRIFGAGNLKYEIDL